MALIDGIAMAWGKATLHGGWQTAPTRLTDQFGEIEWWRSGHDGLDWVQDLPFHCEKRASSRNAPKLLISLAPAPVSAYFRYIATTLTC